jgi:LPXTG-motif cell wall-anchored protein
MESHPSLGITLKETDASGKAYIFTVMEFDQKSEKDFVPKEYKKVENDLVITNTYVVKKLPSTGSSQQVLYLVAGLAMLLAAYFLLQKRRVF